MDVIEPIENLYFNWLCAKVIFNQNPTPSLTYWRLFRKLHSTEFVWLLMGDDNRAEDGKELRVEFLIAGDIPDDPVWRSFHGCSILEMLIAFSKRAEFQTGLPAKDWFWILLENLGLSEINDASDVSDDELDTILANFVWRSYEYDGVGGLFPLENPLQDQKNLEIWYQFFDYLRDREQAS